MLEQMTSHQLGEWESMFDRWNIGDDPNYRGDIRSAISTDGIAHALIGKTYKGKPDNFMPKFERHEQATPQQSADALRNRMLKLADASKPKRRRDVERG